MTEYAANLIIFCCIYGVLAVSLDLLIGDTSVFSAAHAVFFAVGSYSVALVQLHWTQNFLVAVVTGVIAIAPGRLRAYRNSNPTFELPPGPDARRAGIANAVAVLPDGWGTRLIALRSFKALKRG